MDNRGVQGTTDTESRVISAIEQYPFDLDAHGKSVLSDFELSANENTV